MFLSTSTVDTLSDKSKNALFTLWHARTEEILGKSKAHKKSRKGKREDLPEKKLLGVLPNMVRNQEIH